ncbi:unnamed protein product [Gordionus sp. m RMFG-2023]
MVTYWNRKCFQTSTYIYIKNLAFCMLITGGIILPQKVHDFSHLSDYFEVLFFSLQNIKYFLGTFLCKLINFLPIFCLFVQIAFIWVISVERLIKITKVTPSSVLSLNLNNVDHQKRYQTYKISAACWLFGILVAIPTLIIYDIVYVLIENGSVAHKYSEENNSFFSLKYYLERDGYQSAIFYKEKNTSLLYKYNSTVESAKRALSNILFNISSMNSRSLHNPVAKFWNPKLRYLIPHLVNVDRSPMYFFKALDFIPYGLILSNKHEPDIDKDFP